MSKQETMKDLMYEDSDFLNQALCLINQNKSFKVSIPSRQSKVVSTAILFHDSYFSKRLSGHKDLWLWFKFAYYGFRTPTLWGVLSKSYVAGYTVEPELAGMGVLISLISKRSGIKEV